MKKLVSSVLFLLFASGFINSQDITGAWHGQADLGTMKLRIVFNILQAEDGSYTATMDSPDQGAKGIAVESVSYQDDTLTIEIPQIMFVYKAAFNGEGKLEGTLSQFGNLITLNMTREEIKLKRPQEPQEPFPYISEDVVFRNEKAGILLAGTLTMPDKGNKFPAVVLITGSGPQNRDEEVAGHKPFLILADYLTRNGIAVLRYDDRGVADSGGSFAGSTSFDFASDAGSALSYLKSRKEIDKDKIGLLGHSEGGTIAFILAAGNKEDIAFIVSMAGTGIKGDSLLLSQREALFRAMGMSDDFIENDKQRMWKAFGYIKETTDEEVLLEKFTPLFSTEAEGMVNQLSDIWMLTFLDYDPQDDLKKIECPVLALNGEKDLQVLAPINLNAIRENIESNGNTAVTVIKYPGVNHLFQKCETGFPMEYQQIEETITSEVLEDISNWILKITE